MTTLDTFKINKLAELWGKNAELFCLSFSGTKAILVISGNVDAGITIDVEDSRATWLVEASILSTPTDSFSKKSNTVFYCERMRFSGLIDLLRFINLIANKPETKDFWSFIDGLGTTASPLFLPDLLRTYATTSEGQSKIYTTKFAAYYNSKLTIRQLRQGKGLITPKPNLNCSDVNAVLVQGTDY